MKTLSAAVKVVLIFFAINISVLSQTNHVPLNGKAIILEYWQICKDSVEYGVPKNPIDGTWSSINEITQNKKYEYGNWKIKTEIVITDSLKQNTLLGLFFGNLISSYEIYWDGKKIAQNGILGNDHSSEIFGKFQFGIPISQALTTPGNHTLVVRISNHRNDSSWKWYYGNIYIGDYASLLRSNYKSFYQSFLFIGLLFIPFIFNIFLFITRNKKIENLLFSLICFLVLLDSTIAAAAALVDLPTTFIHVQYYSYNIITLLFTILFPTFFIYFFSFSKKLILPIAILNIIILLLFTNIFNAFNIMSLTVLIVSSIIAVWAVKLKREFSIIILVGIVVSWITYFINIAFAGFASTMVICVSLSIAIQFAKSEKAESESKLKSSRLENELLKKNINPHFLLNTLTSIIAWLRKEPESAIKLIEALAVEFRMVNQISSQSIITMKQEIEICRTHLQIMNYRKKSNFILDTFDIIEEEEIPPMIFHTLIENGLTHGYENKTEGVFTLKRIKTSEGIQYCLMNDGEFSEADNPDSSGVGFNYIKGRLEEVYSGSWSFASHRISNGWETIIEVRNK